MITGIWVCPEDPDENDCVILRYADQEVSPDPWTVLIDGNGDALPFEGEVPDTWTQVFPVTGVHNQIIGNLGAGRAIQAGNVQGGIHITH